MVGHSSDLPERRPAFNALMADVQHCMDYGDFEGVNPATIDRLNGVFPVGIRPDGSLDVPENYNPLCDVPLLVLRRDEQRAINRDQYMQATAAHLAAAGLIHLDIEPEAIPSWGFHTTSPGGHVLSDRWLNDTGSELVTFPLVIYQTLLAANGDNDRINAMANVTALMHELDQWDFHWRYNFVPIVGSLEDTDLRFATAAKRRAHATSYRIQHNQGRQWRVAPPEAMVAASSAGDPKEFGREMVERFEQNTRGLSWPVALSAAHVAMAITLRYADVETGDVTDDEVRAYQAAELI